MIGSRITSMEINARSHIIIEIIPVGTPFPPPHSNKVATIAQIHPATIITLLYLRLKSYTAEDISLGKYLDLV